MTNPNKYSSTPWISDPSITEKWFDPKGPVAAATPNFRASDVQTEYAAVVAETIARGALEPGKTTFLQADTGVGKTLGYLIPGLVNAVRTKHRMLISTYTLELQRQILSTDGPRAIEAVTQITGRAPIIAARRARSQFASPTRCETLADKLAGAPETALRHLAAFARDALSDVIQHGASLQGTPEWIANGTGLITTWAEQEPHHALALKGIDRELYALDALSPAKEQFIWTQTAALSRIADCLITTHASTIIDMKLWGKLHGGDEKPFGLVVLDEADQLSSAAKSVLGSVNSINGMRHAAQTLIDIMMAHPKSNTPLRLDVVRNLSLFQATTEIVLDELARIAPGPGMPSRAMIDPGADWVGYLDRLIVEGKSAISAFKSLNDETVADDLHRFAEKVNDAQHFSEILRKPSKTQTVSLDFSPFLRNPSLSVMPMRGARIISRLWNENVGMADAIVMTSATLAMSGLTKINAFRHMISTVGLQFDEELHNADLSRQLSPKTFGSPTFVLADPLAPLPNRDGDNEKLARNPAWVDYVARGVLEAKRRDAAGAKRIFVMTTSHEEAAAIGEAVTLSSPAISNALMVRGPRDNLNEMLDVFETVPGAVMITAGAWEGINRPGMIDIAVIPRLPFPVSPIPSLLTSTAQPTPSLFDMMRRFRQGLGRAIRRMSDAPEIWILDPRVGLPNALVGSMTSTGDFLLPNDRSQPIYLSAIPERFQRALNKADVFLDAKVREKAAKSAAKVKKPRKLEAV